MRVEFFGTAGFHPNEERHTSGLFVPDAAPNDAFLIDAGTGTFRLLGRKLPPRLHVFLTHAHLDHCCGLTFLFNVIFGGETEIFIYSNAPTIHAVKNLLFNPALFPLDLPFELREVVPGESFQVAGANVNTFLLTHPGGALAYRFDWPHTSLATVTDTTGDGRYFSFIRGTKVLIHERNFPDDMEDVAEASGHCTSTAFVDAARDSGASIVAATHFDPLTPGDPLEQDDVLTRLPGVISARDGMIIEF
jgi:ribonuclease BN (tRNA processing enzyme)